MVCFYFNLVGKQEVLNFLEIHPDVLEVAGSLKEKVRAVKKKIFNERQKERNKT